ncbi:Calcium uniporter protein 6, mitochondrial [Coccomyxa sp. Obi]|nr:Calcium uniporter protein 6, mitochondrial [Coccomyxa sp. Obi]
MPFCSTDDDCHRNSLLVLTQTLDIIRFREHLARESEQKLRVTYPELLQMCKDSGAAHSDSEAERICEALRAAGIVLKVGDLVYLRPQEVTAMVMRALPDTEAEVLGRLRELEAELRPLAEQKHKIDTHARRRTNGVLWAGLVLLVVQWSLFLRLTFWELSWDVMEPISYFFSSLWGILAYCYFLVTKEDFAFRHSYSKMTQTFRVGGERDHGFDRARYEQLLQEIRRYRGYLRAAADNTRDAPDAVADGEAESPGELKFAR